MLRVALWGAVFVLASWWSGASEAKASWCIGAERGYAKTKYPIVLAHGAFGFRSVRLLGVDILDYWYDLDTALSECGGAEVFVTQVSPSNSTEVRGEQLLSQVRAVLAKTGAAKVNIIGHSMGGLDARYVMNVRPDLVASVTTIGSPHKGSETFDRFVSGLDPEGRPLPWLSNALGNAMELVWGLLTGYEGGVDALAAVQAQLTPRARAWNERYPAGVPRSACGEGEASFRGIRLYSWTGDDAAPWTTSLNPLVSLDWLFNSAFGLFEALHPERTDGLVAVCSAHFGDVLRDDFAWNHTDQVNLLWGLTADFEADPKGVFRSHANRLKRAGL
jgi:triacylglycerol lipase